jgi:uncharacterized protein (DUF58 family)
MWDPGSLLDDVSRSLTSPWIIVPVAMAAGVIALVSPGVISPTGAIVGGGIVGYMIMISLSKLRVATPQSIRRLGVATERIAEGFRGGGVGVAAVAAVAAILAVVLGGLAVAAPASLLDPVVDLLSGTGTAAAIGVALVCLVVASLPLWAPELIDAERPAPDEESGDDAESRETYPITDDGGSTGERIDDLLEHVESDAIPWRNGDAVVAEAENVWRELRELAVEAVAERDGCSSDIASTRVATGKWTDDPYAASFLQDLSTPVLPARVRVADWLRGRHLTRRIRHTVDAIADARGAASRIDFGDGVSRDRNGAGEADPAESDGAEVTHAAEEAAAGSRSVQRGMGVELRPAERAPGNGAHAGLVVGVAAVIVGTLLGNAAVLLSAIVGFAYAAYGYTMPDPETGVRVERSIETPSPAAGASVAVSVTVTNEGETAIPDLSVRDTPPEGLAVIGGETALATSLEAGETAALSYRVEATTGTHHFGETKLVAENVSGTARFRADVTIDARLSCDHTTDAVPLSNQTTPFEGRVPADAGGTGTEFYATREYRAGDPPNRIDWNRYAATRDPTTIEFREHRAAEVLVVLDADSPGNVRRSPTADPETLGQSASREIVTRLLAANNAVGAARVDRFDTRAFGRRATIDYLRPLADDLQSTRIERLFATEIDDIGSALNSGPFPEESGGMDRCVRFKHDGADRVVRSLPEETQVIALTPLLDDRQVDTLARFLSAGHDVTVAMPDVLPDTPGGRIDGLDRADRIDSLRRRGAVVLPWNPEEPLSIALARSPQREVVTA